jgi:lipopolysaccharide export system permease protein
MPQLINMILPIAVFVAALVALNRLHTEQEIVVCFAGGMSRWRVISPAMRLASTIAFMALLMNLWIQPISYRALREELFKIKTDLAATIVREGEFTEPVPGLTVYAQDVDGKGEMHNLFIHQVKDNGGAVTYMANKGHIVERRGQSVLVLQDGSTQEFSPRGVLQYLTFNEYPFELSSLDTADELVHYKTSDRYMHELFFPDRQQAWEKKNRKALLAEGNARIATPLYNIAFMALALWAIVGGGFSRLGYGRRMVIAFAVMTTTRVLGFVALSAAEGAVWVNVLQYLIPAATTWLSLRGLFRQKVSRRIALRPRRLAPAGAPA